MRFAMRYVPLVLALAASPVLAAGEQAPRPLAGRYALHREACKANDIFMTLSADKIDLPVFSCMGLTFKPAGSGPGDRATWDVAGRRCQGEESAPGPQRFRLEATGTTVRIHWKDRSKSAPLHRCGP